MLCCNSVEPKKNECLYCCKVGILHFGLDKSLGIQIDIDCQNLGDSKVTIVVDVGKVGKEASRNFAELAALFGFGKMMNHLALLQAKCCDEGLDIAFLYFQDSFLGQILANGQNGGAFLPKKICGGSDQEASPAKVQESNVDVVHVEMFGLSLVSNTPLKGIRLFLEDAAFFPILLFDFDICNQLACRNAS